MSAQPAAMISQLASLIGLDDATVKEQILPYLSSMRSRSEVEGYLQSLLPPGPAAATFTQKYLALRFPPPAPPTGNPVRVPSGSGSKRAQVVSQDRAAIAGQFGSSGKVYQKNRDDEEGGWGGRASGKASPAAGTPTTGTSRSSTPVQPTPATAHLPKLVATISKAKAGHSLAPATLDISEAASAELLEVDRTLRLFTPPSASSIKKKGKSKDCFCAARLHGLSPYTPICPSCALPLCALHPPIASCPSCDHSPLLSASAVAQHVAALTSRREAIIAREEARARREAEEAERERRAIRFPGLGDSNARAPGQGAGGRRGYADLVGGGQGTMEERIERGYRDGVTAGGRAFGQGPAASAPARVLRLNMNGKKTKTTIQTKVASKTKAATVEVVEAPTEEPESEDEGAWIDPEDDAFLASRSTPSFQRDPSRPFLNVTLSEAERPKWTEPVEVELVDEAPQEEVDVIAPRAAVPGAGLVEPKKKARSRGKKGGERGGEKAGAGSED